MSICRCGKPIPAVRYQLLRDIIGTGLSLGGPSPASTGSERRSAPIWPSSKIRPSWTSCVGSRPPSIPTASSIRGPSSTWRLPDRTGQVNGAQALIRTLVDHGVDTCFMNPGTSEMHFVAALDEVPAMHSVLALFEGVATGAADGYARLAGRPAATLLHLGPGLGNGLANLHNARRAHSPVVNIVGDHALSHRAYDAQLQSDIETVARNVSTFVRTSESTVGLSADALAALAAAVGPPGSVATLILPADVSWSDGGAVAHGPARRPPPAGNAPDGTVIASAAAALRSGEPSAILIGGRACSGAAFGNGGRHRRGHRGQAVRRDLSHPTRTWGRPAGGGATGLSGRVHRHAAGGHPAPGAGGCRVAGVVLRLPGEAERPGARGLCRVPGGRRRRRCADCAWGPGRSDPGPPGTAVRQQADRPDRPTGPLTAQGVCQALGALLPEGAIVSDEGNTSGLFAPGATAGAPPHDWLCLTGGAIGQGLPVAVGAAVADPDRRVIALEADGSALYTLQAWWTMAREGLDVTTILLNNHSYAVLNMELDRVGVVRPGRGRGPCSTSDARRSTSCSWPVAWVSPPRGPRRPRSSPTSWPGRWPHPARAWSRRSSPRCSDLRAPTRVDARLGVHPRDGGGPALV